MSQAQDKLIGSVPARIVDGARLLVTAYEGRVAEYNVATWLHIPGLANLPVSLLVSYRDGENVVRSMSTMARSAPPARFCCPALPACRCGKGITDCP